MRLISHKEGCLKLSIFSNSIKLLIAVLSHDLSLPLLSLRSEQKRYRLQIPADQPEGYRRSEYPKDL